MASRQSFLRIALATGFVAFGLAGCGSMQPSNVDEYRASLNGTQEVPPTGSSATGAAELRFNRDTRVLSWKVTYSGLSGPATAGHIHGPAAAGQNAGVSVPFSNVNTQPVAGEATLTAQQAADLAAGRMYINIHSARNPGGEIRGQVMASH